MWILSQDETELIEANQMVVIKEKVVCNKWVLGRYESEEVAKKVLVDIASNVMVDKVYIMPKY